MHDGLERLFARPIAHRGLHACGRPGPIENSPAAAEAAIAAGYGIECDIQLTADGDAVVFHDARLDRLTEAEGATARQDAKTLSGLLLKGSSDRIPTLAAFLELIAGRTPLVVEIKVQAHDDMRLVDRALTLARAYRGPIALESFDPAVVLRCRAAGARYPIGLVGPPEDMSAADADVLAACDFMSWNIDHLSEMVAQHPHLPRSTWTVRLPAQEARAHSLGAQIVFEGFTPLARR